MAAIFGLLSIVTAAFLLIFWVRERARLETALTESSGRTKRIAELEGRFGAIADADIELKRVESERVALVALCERDEAWRQQSAASFEAELHRQRAEHDQVIFAERARATQSMAGEEAAFATRRSDWEKQFSEAMQALEHLHKEVDGLSEEAEIQSFGLYKPRFAFATAAEFKLRLERVRDLQKRSLKEKTAAACGTTWKVDGSAAEGRRMISEQIKLMLRGFNGDCDGIVASVTWKNVATLQDRMRKSFEAVNKLGQSHSCAITDPYLMLKEEELQLAHEYAEKVQEEREEQRERRERMREEERANREFEQEREEAEREEEKYESAIDRARAEVTLANEKERTALDAKIAKLEAMLEKAAERRQRAVSQAEITRSGYVYIISNTGTFGPNVFKIGLTRRRDPLDRVVELGGAPVPFHFDVHALIFSDDAPGLEAKLHAALEPHRVNLVNPRKEFFRVPLEKIVDLVTQHHGKISFNEEVASEDYRKTLAIRAEREAMATGKDVQASALRRVDEVRSRFEDLKRAMF